MRVFPRKFDCNIQSAIVYVGLSIQGVGRIQTKWKFIYFLVAFPLMI